MPANATMESSGYTDTFASCGVPYFNGITGPHWEIKELKLRNGPKPSSARVVIPLAELDQIAPRVAGVTGGPLDEILIGTQCVLKAGTPTGTAESIDDPNTTLAVMRVSHVDMKVKPDFAEIELLDDRWILEACQIIGSWWMSGTNDDGEIAYRQGEPFHVNPRGEPNGIWRVSGGVAVKVMCPPRYGLTDLETPPDPTDTTNTTKATHFTAQDVLVYFQFIITQDAYNRVKEFFPWYPFADPTTLDWDSDYAGAVIDSSAAEFRKAREAVYQGVNVLDAISEVLQSCGNYALTMQSAANADGSRNVVAIVPTRYLGQGGIAVLRPCGGAASSAFVDGAKIIDGELSKGGRNLYTKFAAGGARVVSQTRVQMFDEATAVPLNNMGTVVNQLQVGYDDDLLAKANALMVALMNETEESAFDCAESETTVGHPPADAPTPEPPE